MRVDSTPKMEIQIGESYTHYFKRSVWEFKLLAGRWHLLLSKTAWVVLPPLLPLREERWRIVPRPCLSRPISQVGLFGDAVESCAQQWNLSWKPPSRLLTQRQFFYNTPPPNLVCRIWPEWNVLQISNLPHHKLSCMLHLRVWSISTKSYPWAGCGFRSVPSFHVQGMLSQWSCRNSSDFPSLKPCSFSTLKSQGDKEASV